MSSSAAHRRNVLAAAVVGALMISPCVAFAQDAQAQQPTTPDDTRSAEASTLDTVTVTGSRISRANIEGPAPVTIISSEQMRREGFATVYDALQTITQALGPVQNDYDWGQTSVNAYPINLRNLGPGRSLLLINGHRVADYPMPYQGKSNFANFNNIPTGIVDRIEILSGSASAIYGSDAMGGVINVILKENMDDHVLRVRYGEATRGGRENTDVVFSGGASGDNWNLVYNLQYFDRGVLLAKDRPFMDEESDKDFVMWGPGERHFGVAMLRPYAGLYLIDRDSPNAEMRITPPDGACDQYGDLYFLAERLAFDRNTGTEGRTGFYCAQRVFQNWALRTGSRDTSGYLHGSYDFDNGVQAWASLGYWKTTGDFNTFLDGFASGDYWDPRANNGAGGSRYFLKFMSPQEMGANQILTESDETAIDFSAGLRGTMAGDRFDWEATVGRATYSIHESFPTLNQGDMFDFFMGPQQGTAANGMPVYTPDYDLLWNPLSTSQTGQFSARGLKKARSWLTQAQFVVSGDLFEGWAGPIGFAAVGEIARQGYRLTPDPKTLNQDADGWYTPFGNIEQGGGERDRYAIGAEFNVPLAETVNMNLAARYDDYDAVSSDAATTYQLGLEWRPLDTLLVRGSWGTSFRAPDMHYIYAKPSSGISDFTDYVACADAGWPNQTCPRDDFKIEDANVERTGTPDLKYEEGESYTVGFVWDAFTGFSLSADYWSIKIDNLINDISAEQLLLDEAYCTRNGFSPDGSIRAVAPTEAWCNEVVSRVQRTSGVPGSTAGSVDIIINPINRAETQVTGVDVNARYNLPATRSGDWGFNLNYTNMLTFKERGFPTDPLEDTRKTQNPRTRLTLSTSWNYDKWNATVLMYQKSGGRNNRWGGCLPLQDGFSDMTRVNDETCEDTNPASPTYGQTSPRVYDRRPTRRYFNGSVGYQINEAFKVNLYVSNIFNKIYGDKWCGDFAYCIDDPVGREVAGEIVFKF